MQPEPFGQLLAALAIEIGTEDQRPLFVICPEGKMDGPEPSTIAPNIDERRTLLLLLEDG